MLAILIYTQLFKGQDNEFETDSGYIYTNSSEEEEIVREFEEGGIILDSEKEGPISQDDHTSTITEISDENFREFDFEAVIQQRVGEKAYQIILQQAEQAMNLLAAGELQGWDEIATPSLVDKIFEGEIQLLHYSKIDSLEVFPTKQVNENDVIIGSIINAEDDVKSYQLIFTEQQGIFLISEIVLMWSN